ncbi:MAG: hypothetical protein PHW77_09770 [Eubacteriales bacterium]|nr:hypothetical protein [Eubacteriales bacterium]
MKKHPFIAGMIIGFCVILIITVLGLLAFPELIYIYRAVSRYFAG